MKKIITIVLAIACAFTLFSCGDDESVEASTGVNEIIEMYNAVSPSRIETVATKAFGKFEFKTTSTLVIGEVDGFSVTTFNQTVEKPNGIDESISSTILGLTKTEDFSWVYHEDLGYKENGGKWDLTVEDPTPVTGAIALNISEETVTLSGSPWKVGMGFPSHT